MKRSGLILAVAIILVANGIALMYAARNRSGSPLQTIELTERELPLQSMGEDNSGVGLMLRWRWQDKDTYFDRAKMEGAGFDFRIYDGSSDKDIAPLSRVAYVAMEYEGKAWEQLQQRESEQQMNQPTPPWAITNTRLLPVDLSQSLSELRNRYPDQARYLIVKGLIRARVLDSGSANADATQPGKFVGFVAEILPSNINVPPPFTKLLSPLKPQAGKEPRYTVTLKYGQYLEPWVSAVAVK